MPQKNVDELASDMSLKCAEALLKYSELNKDIPPLYTVKGFYAGYAAALLFVGYDLEIISKASEKSIAEIKKAEFYQFLDK